MPNEDCFRTRGESLLPGNQGYSLVPNIWLLVTPFITQQFPKVPKQANDVEGGAAPRLPYRTKERAVGCRWPRN